MSDATIKTAVQDTGLFMQDIEERLKYINRQMAIMDYNSDMDGAREEGREEMATTIAMNMLRNNEPVNKIVEYTSLTTERIQELAKEI